MNVKTRKTLSTLLGLALLAGLGYGLYWAVRTTAFLLGSLDSQIAVATVAASATVLVSVTSIVLAKAYEARSFIRQENRQKKVPVYESLVSFMFRATMGSKLGKEVTEKEMMEFMADFTEKIIVWGSDEVLAAWGQWRRASVDPNVQKNPIKLVFLFEKLLFTIRRDLGHKNKNLKTGDVLALFVNDIDKRLAEASS